MKLSVIVPAYNEAATIKPLLTALLKQKAVYEVIVVNDASSDETASIVKRITDKRLTLVNHKINKGKGVAIVTGLTHATGDYVLIQDADLEYDPRDIPTLLQPIVDGRAEVVYGSRFTGPHRNMFFWHLAANVMLNFLVNILFNTTVSDMETCYKVMPKKLLADLNLSEHGFGIEPEITCKILKRGLFIYETPISYFGRTYDQGKKISWKDGVAAVWIIVRERFT